MTLAAPDAPIVAFEPSPANIHCASTLAD